MCDKLNTKILKKKKNSDLVNYITFLLLHQLSTA